MSRRRVSWPYALGLGAAFIIALGFVHPVAYTAPTLRSADETLMTLLALTAAVFVAVQFLHARRLRSLVVFGALVTLALIEFLASAIPATLHIHATSGLTALQPLGRLIVGAAFVAAALTPSDRVITGGRHPLAITVGLSVAAAGLADAIGLLAGDSLLAGAKYSGAQIDGALDMPMEWVVVLCTVGLFLYAAYRLAWNGGRPAAPSQLVLAVGAMLLGAARFYELSLSSIAPEVVTPREVLRIIAFGLILAAAVLSDHEIRGQRARAAALAERRRVAEDLHDGLAQDLALIAAHQVPMAKEWGPNHPVAVAAQHALALSRDTISALNDLSSTPPQDAFEAVAHELRDRFGLDVAVHVDPDTRLTPDVHGQVLRVLREAINNAARHGDAESVVVSLTRVGTAHMLRVSDNGRGIDDADQVTSRVGFGIRNMRERAAALDGRLSIRHRRGGGTELTLVFP